MQNYSSKQVCAMTWLFSPRVIKELAYEGSSSSFSRLVKEANLEHILDSGDTKVMHIYDEAYDVLKNGEYRCAYIYKNILAKKRFLGIHSLKTASLLSEFRVGNSKADIVILNGTSTAYEIKSERDSFSRLDGQLRSYLSVFDNVYVITGEKTSEQLKVNIPNNVGIMVLNKRQQVTTIRKAISNKEHILPEILFDSLTRKEAESILRLYDIPIPDVPNTLIRSALKAIFISLGPVATHDGAVKVLRQSRSLSPLGEFISELPASLVAAGISASLPRVAQGRFLNVLHTDANEVIQWK